ncbi:hypothetical protein [Ruminiclostridium cellobioparum]|nr:hypothetical protein [Ruminiclostridium cellobioparum]
MIIEEDTVKRNDLNLRIEKLGLETEIFHDGIKKMLIKNCCQ